jgi:hypothetical protein
MSGPTWVSRALHYIKSALMGAALGVAIVAWNAWWERFTGRSPFDGRPLAEVSAVATIAGSVIGIIHHATRKIRLRGRLYDYGSWMMACTLGALVVIGPELPQRGFWWTVLFALWLGVSGGLAFGVISRQLNGHRW